MNAITIQPSRMPIPAAVAKEFEIAPAEWRVLVDQIFPSAKSVEAVMMALAYCRKRNLDIFKKPVHIVPMWSSAKKQMVETVWPGIAEIRTTASRTGEYAGIDAVEFGPMIERSFSGQTGGNNTDTITKKVRFPEYASVVVYRIVAGQKCAYHAKVFWEETYASIGKSEVPNDMWAKRPRGQLDKCVEAAALRKAFPEELGNTYAAEEMEGRTLDGAVVEHAAAPQPPRPPVPPSAKASAPVETIDAETGEILDEREIVTETGGATVAIVDETLDDNTFFERLEEALAVVSDLATVEEIWTDFDPLARFEGKPAAEINQSIALAIRKRAEKRIGGSNGKA
ncbi:phage recombination protein Bet [Mesorhizobium sp. M0859]|uniref:phage recombination protein Bet n=1 Tax=Mesorhizobium sp. M0859 TaxID=2957014 RepID=UPI00333BB4CD